MISLDIDYRDLGAEHYLSRADPVRQARRLVSQLHQLGYQAVVTPVR
jgi:hypothetical protein